MPPCLVSIPSLLYIYWTLYHQSNCLHWAVHQLTVCIVILSYSVYHLLYHQPTCLHWLMYAPMSRIIILNAVPPIQLSALSSLPHCVYALPPTQFTLYISSVVSTRSVFTQMLSCAQRLQMICTPSTLDPPQTAVSIHPQWTTKIVDIHHCLLFYHVCLTLSFLYSTQHGLLFRPTKSIHYGPFSYSRIHHWLSGCIYKVWFAVCM